MDILWIIVQAESGIHCWEIGAVDSARTEDLVLRARIALGVAAEDPGRGVVISPGEPHHTLLARATVGRLEELDAVPAAQVAAYREALLSAGRIRRVDQVHATISALSLTDQGAVRTRMGWNGVLGPQGGGRD